LFFQKVVAAAVIFFVGTKEDLAVSIRKNNQFKAALGDNYEKVKSGEITRAQAAELLQK
jgi:hypothetical protein